MDRRDFITSLAATSALGKAVLSLIETEEPGEAFVIEPSNDTVTNEKLRSEFTADSATLTHPDSDRVGLLLQTVHLKASQDVTVRKNKKGETLEIVAGKTEYELTAHRLVAPKALLDAFLKMPALKLRVDGNEFLLDGVLFAGNEMSVTSNDTEVLLAPRFTLRSFSVLSVKTK